MLAKLLRVRDSMKKIKLSEILTPDVITVATGIALREVLSTMAALRISCVLAVNSKNQPLGIFTEQDALRVLAGQQALDGLVMADVMTIPPLCASPDMDYRDAFRLLQEHGSRHLIVTDAHNRLLGIVTEEAFLLHLGSEELTAFKTVASVMAHNVATIDEGETVATAAQQMHRLQLSCIVVTRDAVPVGILTERDAVRLELDISEPGRVPVGSVMSCPLITVSPDTTLEHAIQHFASNKIRNLVVTDQGRLSGIVNRHNLVNTLRGDYVKFLQETIKKQRRKMLQLNQQCLLNKLHSTALEASANAILITDTEGIIQWANAAFSNLSGYSSDEVIGRRPKDLIKSGLQSREFYEVLWQTILSGQAWQGELVNKRRDGTLYTEELTITPVRTENDKMTHFIAVMQDISERKLLEKMQAASLDVLDKIIANQPLPDMMLAIIHHLENLFPIIRASVLQLDATTGLLRQVIAPSLPDFYASAIERLQANSDASICEMAAFSGETVIIEDVQSHPRCVPFRELAERAGFRACTATPIKDGQDNVLGIFTVYFVHPHFPGQTKLNLLKEFARLAGISIAKDKTETQRLALTTSLQNSEARYRTLVEAAPFPVVISSLADGSLLYGNDRAQLMFGISREQGIGKPAALFYVHPEERDRFVSAVLEKGLVTDYEVQLYKSGGKIIWVLLSGRVMDFDGQAALTTSFVEITDRKHYEDRLREAAAVMESTHEGVMITDLTPRIIAVNRACLAITGYTEEELIGKNPAILHSGHKDQAFYAMLWQQLLRDGHWQGEILNRRKSGEIYPQWLTISTIYNEQQEPVRYVGVFADISELKRQQAQLDFMAHHDALTRLPNRSMVETRIKQEIEQAHRHGQNLAVLFIDLDRFKIVNDSFGHPVGDELLCQVAERLAARLREGDMLARLGGDEFILLANTLSDAQDAAVLARDIIAALGEPFMLSGQHEVFIGGSIGISLFPDDGNTVTELMKNADAAMYFAKENGRNQFSFYTSELNADARHKLEMENDLRRALLHNELLLHYQAKIDLHTGKICGVEALIRWQKPDGTLMSPAEFIPLAEKTGVILTIGNLVLDRACQQIRQWLDDGLDNVHIAVNISARQFRNGNLDKLVAESLQKYQIDGRHLELELNESMLMHEPERAIETMQKLKNIGVKLSLDDFGTGYSNLAYLRRFPIDSLKIDQSFVRGMIADPGDAEIASVIINLAHRLKLSVIAEGVENETQLAFMRTNNCDELQGYLFSKALSAPEFTELLRSGKTLTS